MQVDVIEAQFSVLLKAVQNANEFEDIIKVHHEFISNLLAKTFVLTPDEVRLLYTSHRLVIFTVIFFRNIHTKINIGCIKFQLYNLMFTAR